MNERQFADEATYHEKLLWTDRRCPRYRVVQRTYADGSSEILAQESRNHRYGAPTWDDIDPIQLNEAYQGIRFYPKILARKYALEAAIRQAEERKREMNEHTYTIGLRSFIYRDNEMIADTWSPEIRARHVTIEDAEKNAQTIIHQCSCYEKLTEQREKLLEALKSIHQAIIDTDKDGFDRTTYIARTAYDAIAQAENQ